MCGCGPTKATTSTRRPLFPDSNGSDRSWGSSAPGASASRFYLTRSEREAGRGFPDLFLEPFLMKHPDLRHSYLIELKYLRRGEDTPERRAALIADGAAQLRRYLADVDLRRRAGSTQLHGLLLVYHGWELVERREVE